MSFIHRVTALPSELPTSHIRLLDRVKVVAPMPLYGGLVAGCVYANHRAVGPIRNPRATRPPSRAKQSPYHTTGFIVDESRLPGYDPTPPGKKDNSSWVWVHGEAITDHKTSTRRWMCKICYDDPVLSRKPFEKWIREAHPVNYAKRHMASHGYDEAGNKTADSCGKRKHADIRRQFEEQEHATQSGL
ncbi:hypothetical protein MBLNU13_g09736t1 [Cladosporium sp. NU13]